ncbi:MULTISPECIES: hypothetical protein [unclassified Synechococcus]|uniref:hypothetical protein n=1 Tax=unclassified Synechococcus TaxID=2626047 RepID=UPI001CF8004C|nr:MULTISPECIES: hypothetical protein [unclassified Synechococcus]
MLINLANQESDARMDTGLQGVLFGTVKTQKYEHETSTLYFVIISIMTFLSRSTY